MAAAALQRREKLLMWKVRIKECSQEQNLSDNLAQAHDAKEANKLDPHKTSWDNQRIDKKVIKPWIEEIRALIK